MAHITDTLDAASTTDSRTDRRAGWTPGTTPAAFPALPFGPTTQLLLANGLRVVVVEDQSLPIASVNLWYGVAARDEPEGKHGFAHLFEHLMFEGSRNIPTGGHFARMESIGATGVNATTNSDRTNYFQTVPVEHLPLTLWLEADRMGSLADALNQATLDNQREVVKNEKRQRYDNVPYGDWVENLQNMLFPAGHPYAHTTIGSLDHLNAAALEDFTSFHRAYYTPDNAVLTVVGAVTPAYVRELAERYFGGIPTGLGIPASPACPAVFSPGEVRRTITAKVPNETLYVAYRTPSFGTDANEVMTVTAAVLGGGRGSRLKRSLVFDRLLARENAAPFSEWQQSGGVSIACGRLVPRDGVPIAELEAALYEETAKAAVEITEDDIDRARGLIHAGHLSRLADSSSLADELGRHAMVFGDPTAIGRRYERMMSVTAEEVAEAVATYLVPENRAVLTYLPETETTEKASA